MFDSNLQSSPSRFAPLMALAALFCFAAAWGGCSNDPQEESTEEPPDLADIDNSDYFPMEPGMRWVYDLECPSFNRSYQWNLVWPSATGETKTYLERHDGTISGDTGQLVYTVVEKNVPPPALGSPTYVDGVLVQIETDDLLKYLITEADASGIPNLIQPSQIFWVREADKEPTITEVQLFELPETPSEAAPGTQPRQVVHQLFSTDLASVDDMASQVSLMMMGIDTNVPGYEGEPCLHYVRRYAPSDAPPFTENLWYAKDVGLVRLEQNTGGEMSLIQTLREFSH